MPAKRKIEINGPMDAIAAHKYWETVLDKGVIGVVTDFDKAWTALNKLSAEAITADRMSNWLATWPTPLGWKRYRGAIRQRAYANDVIAKISLHGKTARRLRAYARTKGLTLDDAVQQLLDSVSR